MRHLEYQHFYGNNRKFNGYCNGKKADTGSNMLHKLNASTSKIGLEFMTKVMAGDKIDILGKSYYLNTAAIYNSTSTALDLVELMTSMLLSPSNAAAAKS